MIKESSFKLNLSFNIYSSDHKGFKIRLLIQLVKVFLCVNQQVIFREVMNKATDQALVYWQGKYGQNLECSLQ